MVDHPDRKADRRAWLFAWAVSLALHGAAFLAFRNLPLFPPAAAATRPPEVIQLVLRPQENETPQFFTEMAPDRADAAPEKADLLSNVTSRARDRTLGGSEALPKVHRDGDAPAAKLEPNRSASTPSSSSPPASHRTEPASDATALQPQDRSQDSLSSTAPGNTTTFTNRLEDRVAGKRGDESPPGATGNSDIQQPEMSSPDGNASLTGDISLNTTAWNYAPWLERFGRQLMHRWVAPPAYSMGILKEGGWALIEARISPSGKLLSVELLDELGHPSLISAARSAVRSVAPIEPLPADFPEPVLVLRIRMIYPKVLPR